MRFDVIIPLYKPDESLFLLLNKLETQTHQAEQIILMNTDRQYFTKLVDEEELMSRYPKVKVYHVTKEEFNHGRTRRDGVEHSTADAFVCMTQDAMPADKYLFEKLVAHLEDEQVAVAYARQLPREDCHLEERFTRSYNYPDTSRIKTKENLEELGIKTFFCSNVCAAYRRDIYEKLGGFVHRTIFNEDMLFAAKAIEAGYGIAYEADGKVVHSHNYTNMQQLKRNFDLGVSQAEHPEVFAKISSTGEGKKMVKEVTKYLLRQGKWYRIPYFYSQSFFKLLGYSLGKRYESLPQSLINKLTSSPDYWKNNL